MESGVYLLHGSLEEKFQLPKIPFLCCWVKMLSPKQERPTMQGFVL
jgi:hypothetical protein